MGVLLGRRAVVLGLATAFACSRNERLAGGSPPLPFSPNVKLLQWDLGPQPWGPGRAAVVVPTWGTSDQRFPVVLALHGRGEAVDKRQQAELPMVRPSWIAPMPWRHRQQKVRRIAPAGNLLRHTEWEETGP